MERRNPRGRRAANAGDHDVPYAFGMLPSADRPYPFRLMQYARLLFLRGRLLDGAFTEDREGRYQISEHQGVVWVERTINATLFDSQGLTDRLG
jgi:hypothetical protein